MTIFSCVFLYSLFLFSPLSLPYISSFALPFPFSLVLPVIPSLFSHFLSRSSLLALFQCSSTACTSFVLFMYMCISLCPPPPHFSSLSLSLSFLPPYSPHLAQDIKSQIHPLFHSLINTLTLLCTALLNWDILLCALFPDTCTCSVHPERGNVLSLRRSSVFSY